MQNRSNLFHVQSKFHVWLRNFCQSIIKNDDDDDLTLVDGDPAGISLRSERTETISVPDCEKLLYSSLSRWTRISGWKDG